jgi:hypothetical protein
VARDVEQRARKMIIALPMPHRPSRTSDGLDHDGRLEPQRALDADPAEDRVHRARRRVEDVGEAERRGDRRRQRRQVEDRAEEANAALRAHDHRRDAEGEDHLQRHGDRHSHSEFFTRPRTADRA